MAKMLGIVGLLILLGAFTLFGIVEMSSERTVIDYMLCTLVAIWGSIFIVGGYIADRMRV